MFYHLYSITFEFLDEQGNPTSGVLTVGTSTAQGQSYSVVQTGAYRYTVGAHEFVTPRGTLRITTFGVSLDISVRRDYFNISPGTIAFVADTWGQEQDVVIDQCSGLLYPFEYEWTDTFGAVISQPMFSLNTQNLSVPSGGTLRIRFDNMPAVAGLAYLNVKSGTYVSAIRIDYEASTPEIVINHPRGKIVGKDDNNSFEVLGRGLSSPLVLVERGFRTNMTFEDPAFHAPYWELTVLSQSDSRIVFIVSQVGSWGAATPINYCVLADITSSGKRIFAGKDISALTNNINMQSPQMQALLSLET
jgi:hypothetical protein